MSTSRPLRSSGRTTRGRTSTARVSGCSSSKLTSRGSEYTQLWVSRDVGDKLAKGASNKTLGAGGYALMPANMNHFAYTSAAETMIVLYGVGPVDFKYVNPADDPRNAKSTR